MTKEHEKTFIVEQRKIAFVVARDEDEALEQVANLDNWDWIDEKLRIFEQQERGN